MCNLQDCEMFLSRSELDFQKEKKIKMGHVFRLLINLDSLSNTNLLFQRLRALQFKVAADNNIITQQIPF